MMALDEKSRGSPKFTKAVNATNCVMIHPTSKDISLSHTFSAGETRQKVRG